MRKSFLIILLVPFFALSQNKISKGFSYLALGDSYTIGAAVDVAERWPVQFLKELKSYTNQIDTLQIIATSGWRVDQLKNAMKAKFDHILLPISDILIEKNQRQYITFNAFFSNTMFHEVAHGLGIKETINGKGSVREALGETFSALEEGKADVLGLHMITQLKEKELIAEGELMDYYVTFLAGIFRSVRFGASSAHGKANMLRFNYFKDQNAFTRNNNGTYAVNFDEMKKAIKGLSAQILKLQGDGDKAKVQEMMTSNGIIKETLQRDLDRLSEANIPVDIVFEQGLDVLGID